MEEFVGKIVGKLRYHDWLTRLILSLIAAHYVLAINEPEPFLEFIQLPAYPALLLQNWLIAFLIFSLIYKITRWLDIKFPWTDNLVHRALFQILLGFLIPSFILFFLAYLFFRVNGMDMMETNYLKLEWWFSILFVILVNCYYIIRYLIRYTLIQEDDKSTLGDLDSEAGLIVKYGNELIRLPDHEINYIRTAGKLVVVFASDGQQYPTDKAIKTLITELDRDQFYKIHRSTIVNRNIVLGYGLASSNRLKLKTTVEEEFYVSNSAKDGFKEWWEGD